MSTEELVQLLLLCLHVVFGFTVAAHALLHKHDPRSAWAWILACLLVPIGGAVIYFLFGVNRIHRRARLEVGSPQVPKDVVEDTAVAAIRGAPDEEIAELVRISRAVTQRVLTGGNEVIALHNGEIAYPDIIAAIKGARRRVWLMSYIFDRGDIGRQFAEALRDAQQRGVQVRVLLDGIGAFGHFFGGTALLRRHGIQVAKFLPIRLVPPLFQINLRNHRKLICVDGTTAFVGGMNIGDHHILAECTGTKNRWRLSRATAADVHFRVHGPVVSQLDQVFQSDWEIATREKLEADSAPIEKSGGAHCRAITDGPNAEFSRYLIILLGALANAHRAVCIMTPYFIPPPELSSALINAALRGIEISLILPERSNHAWLDAATRRWLVQMSAFPISVYRRPLPFAHSKLVIVDDYYTVIGSANLDSRSLSLNFELMLEVYDQTFARSMLAHFAQVRDSCRVLDAVELKNRPMPKRLLDAFFWLFSPYL
tara:strand:- start:4007 stop:5458 length:1452 start_codon:yes stop_codon:yes gene_type:complete